MNICRALRLVPDAPASWPLRAQGGLQEVFCSQGDAAAGLGFSLAAAAQAAGGRAILWAQTDFSGVEAGWPYGEGAQAFGLDPSLFLLARARDETQLLQAALEGARCPAIGAAIIEIRGAPKALDLTATRRLALGAEASGAALFLLRVGAEPMPSAARARWRVSPAPSAALAARAPGAPAFFVTLERHRGGEREQRLHLEWDRDARILRDAAEAALSEPVAALPQRGESREEDGLRQAG